MKIRLVFTLICLSILAFDSSEPRIGDIIDSLHGVPVFYNGNIQNVKGRNITETGYNLGLKYQCVEFVKRYYYEYNYHEMPYSYGHARQFYNKLLNYDYRVYNNKRDLYQYKNGNIFKPQVGDILIFDSDKYNHYGHIGIISEVSDYHVEVIQQNYGKDTRTSFRLALMDNKYHIANRYALGWLRMN